MKNCLKSYYYFIIFLCFFNCLSSYAQTIPVKTANELVPAFNSKFGYGSNMKGQSNGWTDETVAGIINKAGGTTLRTTLPDNFIETWGINVRVNAFNTYTNTLGMKDLTCFIEGPSPAHQDNTVYPGNTSPSKLFANLYTPIWNSDGSVNQNNYYANYVYQLVQTYGSYIRFWEVVNEPDVTYNADVSQWLTRAPLPSETPNTLAPFYNYVRMLRITWEVVKKYNPNSFVTTGGIGYDTYLDALLRYTDNPSDGSVTSQYPNKGGAYFDVLSYHVYPSYYLRYWDNSIGNFRYTQNSDFAAAQIIKNKDKMNAVLQKYGYDGTTYPKKYFIVTETNISRRTADWRYSTDEMQRNFGIKTLVLAQKNDLKQIDLFGVGESVNAPTSATISSSDEYKLMGLYENLERDTPGSEKLTPQGVGYKTTAKLLAGYTYDASRTAALYLPATVEGGAFVNNGNYIYALWAKNSTDKSETYSTGYSFPTALNISNVDRYEWDYSTTGSVVKQSSQGLTLNTAPSFFKVSATATTVTTAVAGTAVYRINAGGSQVTNSIGTFAADAYYSPAPGHTYTTTNTIAGTTNGAMYQTERYGTNGTFSYAFPVNNGSYTVKLHFSENYWTAAGKRLFDVSIEGNKVLNNYDIYRKVGAFTATSETFTVTVTDGILNIYFSALAADGGVDQPKVSAIEILNSGASSRTIFNAPSAASVKTTDELNTISGSGIDQLIAYPNPFISTTTLQFNAKTAGLAKLQIFDMQNRLVQNLFSGFIEAGTTRKFMLSSYGLSSGVYIARLTTDTKTLTRQIVLVK